MSNIDKKIILQWLKEDLKQLDNKKKKKLALLASMGILIPFSVSKINKMLNKKFFCEKRKLYLVDILENDGVELTDEIGNKMEYIFSEQTRAIVTENTSKQGEIYEVDIIENDKIMHGYIDGKYLSNNYYDVIETDNSVFDISYISSPNTINLNIRNNENIEMSDTLLSPKSMILSSLDDNSFKEIITIRNDRFIHGYIPKKTIFNNEFDANTEKTIYVNTDDLGVRTNYSNEIEEFTRLKMNSKIKIIENCPKYVDSQFEWYYVAFEEAEHIDFGWVIGLDLTQNPIKYNLKESLETKPIIEPETNIEPKQNIEPEKILELQVVGINDYLNVRNNASKDGIIMTKLKNNEIIYATKNDYENLISADGIEWLKIKTHDEIEGWVSKEYVSEFINTQNESLESTNNKMRTLNLGVFGNQNGYYGIDVNITTAPEALDNLLKNGMPYSSSNYVLSEEFLKPSYVIIKCGATGYGLGEMHFGTTIKSEKSKYNQLIDVCEKNNVPFAIYYYSQAITNEESQKEIDLIKEANDIATNYSMYTNNVFIDFEYSNSSRIFESAKVNGKEYQTKVLNNLLNKASLEMPKSSIHLYTDSNTMSYVINYRELSPEYQKDNWFVNVSNSHEKKLNNLNINNTNIGIFQIGRDTTHGCAVDTNFMYEDFYNKFISKTSEKTIEQPLVVQSEIPNIGISSYAGAVVDASSGEVLYSKNGKEQLNPASITKVLTNYIVLKYGDINDRITYSEAAVKLEGSGYNVENTSRALIPVVQVGNEISVKDAIHMSLMKSENSTTVALQEYIERKTERNFFDIMNEEAKTMGCNSCNFLSSYGNDDAKPEYKKHLVTAEDMARIMAYINNNCPQEIEIMGTSEYTMETGITIKNLITALNPENDSYIEGITGGKNGSTSNAGKTLVLTVERNGRTITIVTLKADSYDQSYEDAKKLADYAFSKINQNNTISQNVNYTHNDNAHVKRLVLS